MLAGHHAFPHARGREAIVHAHMNESVTLPHWPEPIRAVVSSALAKEPGLRPADAWTFASRLRGAMRAMGIGAQASACPVPAPASNVRSAPPEAACDRTMSSHDTLRDETFEVSRDELAGDGARRSGALASRESSTLRVVARPTARVAIASTRR